MHESIAAQIGLLTEKELAVLELLADCKTKFAMAEELGVSVRTIEHHRTQLMRKLKTNSTAGLMRFAVTIRSSHPKLLESVKPSNHNGNGSGNGHGSGEFVPHNGHHAQQPPQSPIWRRNSK